MYKIPDIYVNYYKDFINRDVRQFKLECTIEDNEISESEIASFSIDYDLLSGGEEYTIGNLVAGKLTMTVSNNVSVSETNIIHLTIKLRAEDQYKNEIWIPVPVGKFNVFDITSTNLSKTITAYDDLYNKELEKEFFSIYTYPVESNKIIGEICSRLGIDYDYNSFPDVIIERPPVVTETIKTSDGKYEVVSTNSNRVCLGLNVGTALSSIATLLGGNFFLDGTATLRFVSYPTSVTKSYDFTKFAVPTYGSAFYKVQGLSCTGYTSESIEVKAEENTEAIMALSSPFVSKERLTELLNELKQISYRQVQVKVKGDPALQVGDLIEIYEIDSNGRITNRVQIPILRMNFHYSGGCTNNIESPCKPEVEKTINYKGAISSRLDILENTVDSAKSEIGRINNSIVTLVSIKESIDAMNLFINDLPTELNEDKIKQYNLIFDQIVQSDKKFESEYDLVYNNKYLKYL